MGNPLFTKLSDQFTTATGDLTGYVGSNLTTPLSMTKHYDLRAFHNDSLNTPWVMQDMQLWNAYHFSGMTMDTLTAPRSLVGQTFKRNTMSTLDPDQMSVLDADTIQTVEFGVGNAGNEEWDTGATITLGKDASYRYSNSLAVSLTDGVQQIVASYFNDDILTNFPAGSDTWYIEALFRNFPAQSDTTAGTALTTSGNEITDASRTAALAWGLTQQGGQVDQYVVTNLCTNGGFETDTTGWATIAGTETISRDTSKSKFGSASLKIVTPGGVANQGAFWSQAPGFGGATYTFSLWAWVPTGVTVQLRAVTSSLGQIGTTDIVGNGSWQYATFTGVSLGSGAQSLSIQAWTKNATATTFWIDGAQIEAGSIAHDYIDTNGAVASKGEDSSFFIGRAATNLFRRGQCDDVAGWTSAAGATIAIDASSPSPFSPQSIKVTTPGVVTEEGVIPSTVSGLALGPGVACSGSLYLKGVAGQTYDVWVRINNTDVSATNGATTTVTATGVWQLVTPASVSVEAAKTGDFVSVHCRTHTQRAESFWVAHAMLESGQTICAPYVATSGGATATKPAASVKAPGALLSATQGWVAIRMRMPYPISNVPPSNPIYWLWYGASGDFMIIQWANATTITGFRRVSGVDHTVSATASWAAGDEVTIVFAWDSTTSYLSFNGASFTTTASSPANLVATDLQEIGGCSVVNLGAGRQSDVAVLWCAVGKGTLTDADAATLYALGNTEPTTITLPKTAYTTSIMPMATTATTVPTTIDLDNSYIDFSSDSNFISTATDSIPFSSSLLSLSSGGDVRFRINRNSLTTANLSSLKAVRFRLKSIGNATFKVQALRLIQNGSALPQVAIDSKRNTLVRTVPVDGVEGSALGDIYFDTSRPENQTILIPFNNGHNPTGNDNQLNVYARVQPNLDRIEVDFLSRDTQSRLRIFQTVSGTRTEIFSTAINTNILTAEKDYILKIDLDGTVINAGIYQSLGANLGALVYQTGNQTVTYAGRGKIGYNFAPYNYDFCLYGFFTTDAEFGSIEQKTFKSYTPVKGVTLFSNASPPVDMIPSSGLVVLNDATISTENIGNVLNATKIVRDGSQWYGGLQSAESVYIVNSAMQTITGRIYPLAQVRGLYRAVLVDDVYRVAFMAILNGIKPNQWNDFSFALPAGIIPRPFNLQIHQAGFYADTFYVSDVKFNHTTVTWAASIDNGATYLPFYDAKDSFYTGIKFSTAGTQLRVKGTTHSDLSAWVSGWNLIPHYSYTGHKL